MKAKYNGGDLVLQIAVSELPVEGFSMIGNDTIHYGTIEKPGQAGMVGTYLPKS